MEAIAELKADPELRDLETLGLSRTCRPTSIAAAREAGFGPGAGALGVFRAAR